MAFLAKKDVALHFGRQIRRIIFELVEPNNGNNNIAQNIHKINYTSFLDKNFDFTRTP